MEPIVLTICAIFFFILGVEMNQRIPRFSEQACRACMLVLSLMCLTMAMLYAIYS